ncbi:MAG: aldo/keto reductase [Hespellia sp.]|nr:aldo/keto reductase [Hespellia sp.]
MKHFTDCYTLNNGVRIPCMGFGTYNAENTDNAAIVRTAIEAGYRYFDTASLYHTEEVLGQAIKDSGIPREEFFIVSKLWIDEMGYENAKEAYEKSLRRLQMDYLDLYLIHWPRKNEDDPTWKQLDIETWKALEELYEEGKVRGIGLSNFLPHHIENILSNCRVTPVVDQLEIHPGYSQETAVNYCRAHGIQPQAWSPIGRKALLTHPFIKGLAEKYQVSPAQICLRYIVQKEIIPLPKSSSMERMKQNQEIFDFEITQEDMYMLDTMPPTAWLGEHPDFNIPKKSSK